MATLPVVARAQDVPSDAPVDAVDAEALYEQAFDAFANGEWQRAAALFDAVAAGTTDPVRREVAGQMAARARRTAAQPPPSVVPPTMTPPTRPPPAPPLPPSAPTTVAATAGGAPNQEARAWLLGGTTLYGLAGWGPLIAIGMDSSDERASVAVYLLIAGSSFALPYVATRDTRVTWGMATMGWKGASRGMAHGALISVLTDTDGDALLGMMAGLSMGEALIGTTVAYHLDLSAGHAHAIGIGGDFGGGWGLGLSALAQADSDKGRAALTLVGWGAGTAIGHLVADRRTWTWGDSEMVSTAGLLGVATAAVPLVWADPDEGQEEILAGVLMAGSAAGLFLGDRLVDGRSVSTGQAVLVDLGTIAGALVAAGGSYLATDETVAHGKEIVVTAAVAGALGGFALTWQSLDVLPELPAAGAARVRLLPTLGEHGYRGLALAGEL